MRELENVIELMINMSSEDGIITTKMLPENILNNSSKLSSPADKGLTTLYRKMKKYNIK